MGLERLKKMKEGRTVDRLERVILYSKTSEVQLPMLKGQKQLSILFLDF